MKKITPKIFAEKIYYYESVIDNPASLIELIEKTDDGLISGWSSWIVSDGSYVFGEKKVTNEMLYDSAAEESKLVFDTLSNTLSSYGNHYSEALGIDLGSKAPISISKYFTGTSMGPHTDSSPSPTTENISAVLYLNDDYVGGELRFEAQGVTIKPSAGSIVIFPSTPPFFHESLIITSGVKYMSPAFWHLLQ
jgi:predicted 2-oxoglutarate/Fe(II)-dependent dioxygenase YbiX